jgi:hypothetical protein
MDAKLFRLPTTPNFYAGGGGVAPPFDLHGRQQHSQVAAPDSRYPGWAAQMSDGRLVTNYQNHCSRNVPAGSQFATKAWMTKNARELIRVSRERYADQMGSYLGFDPSVVPPAAVVVQCASDGCERTETGAAGGIGVERAGCAAPPLFGTWEPKATLGWRRPVDPVAGLTQVYEGGRNTPRGR